MTRDEMIEQMASDMVESMDLDSLVVYAQERLMDSYYQLTDEELQQEIEEFFPHLLETDE